MYSPIHLGAWSMALIELLSYYVSVIETVSITNLNLENSSRNVFI